MRKKFIYVFLVINLLFFPSSAFGNSNNNVDMSTVTISEVQNLIDQKLDQTVKKSEVDDILSDRNVLTDKEVMQQLIDLQSDRIGLLQGNISSILNIIATLVAILAFLGFCYGYWLKKQLAEKLEDAERIQDEIKIDKEEIIRSMNEATALKKDLRNSINEVDELNRELSKQKLLYEETIENVERLRKYIVFQDVKIKRLTVLGQFFHLREDAAQVLKKLDTPDHKIWYTEPNLQYKIQKVTGSKPDEHILETIEYYIKHLEAEEANVWKAAKYELEFDDFEDEDYDENFDDFLSFFEDWESYYDDLKRILEMVEAYIAMNDNSDSEGNTA
ncbi:hypothetical protein [Paenibacillus lautus]|uniref:hypothetical protein n=1 Tax=Paenibacillus lautus TaxID=1401 RepID=UPI002DBD9A4D|nr:hypothetical protein [Paenibacillus lautus]MEC0259725.1 hypothetical protein [Paenibacillus lautus]